MCITRNRCSIRWREFGFAVASSGLVITATQIGCALALPLVVPLGDMLPRRRLTLVRLALLAGALFGLGMATSSAALLVGMLVVGLLGMAMTQGLIAYAASSAAPHERGRVVGTTLWPLLLGIVLLDLAGQAIHVVNQSMVFGTNAGSDTHSRLVACYRLFYAAGSGLGAIASTVVYAAFGWHGVCVLGGTISLAGLVFWQLTLSRN